MNTLVASWGWGFQNRIERLGIRIERLGQRLSAWAKVKKQQKAEKAEANLPVIQLSEKAKRRLAKISDEIDAGEDLSPVFETSEEMDAWLDAPDDTDHSNV